MRDSWRLEGQLRKINSTINDGALVIAIAVSAAGCATGSGAFVGVCFALAVFFSLLLIYRGVSEKEESVLSAPVRYRHYKGGTYELLVEAVMEADHTPLIVYRAANGTVWCRPKSVFFGQVEVEGNPVQRFEKI